MIIRLLFLFILAFSVLWLVLGLAAYTNYFGKHRLKKYAKNLLITTVAFTGALVLIGVISTIDKLF